jgi:hypothetical protein
VSDEDDRRWREAKAREERRTVAVWAFGCGVLFSFFGFFIGPLGTRGHHSFLQTCGNVMIFFIVGLAAGARISSASIRADD